MLTFAFGAVVPLTVVESPATVLPPAGALIVTGNAAGGAWRTYRSATIAG